jgi:hypothetical protein
MSFDILDYNFFYGFIISTSVRDAKILRLNAMMSSRETSHINLDTNDFVMMETSPRNNDFLFRIQLVGSLTFRHVLRLHTFRRTLLDTSVLR